MAFGHKRSPLGLWPLATLGTLWTLCRYKTFFSPLENFFTTPNKTFYCITPTQDSPYWPSGLCMLCVILWCALCTLWPLPCIFLFFTTQNFFYPLKTFFNPPPKKNFFVTLQKFWGIIIAPHPTKLVIASSPPNTPHWPSGLCMLCAILWHGLCTLWTL